MNVLKLNRFQDITVPKYFVPGYGYSPASGPPGGGAWMGPDADAASRSSSFFEYNVKDLFPNSFGNKKKIKQSKTIKRSKSKRSTQLKSKTKKTIKRSKRSKRSKSK